MTDAEPSIKALAEAASKEWGGECQLMTAPRGSHASNGACERAILELARQARTLVSSLEERFPGFKLNPKDKHYPWLIRQASWLLTRYLVKADGKTSYERLRGRTYKGSIIEPFESCHYKVADAEKGKRDAQTNTGIWLGKSLQSDEHLVATEHGIRRCRTIWRKPERLRWNLKGFQSWVGLPWQPRGPPTPTPEAIRSGVTSPGTPVPGTPGVKKGVYITVGQQLKHGMRPGCPGCHSSDEHPKRHHAECRARFEKLISEERLKLESKEVLDVEMGAGTSASSRPSAGNTAAVGELPAGNTAATGKSSAGHTAMTSPSAGNTATADGSVAGRPAPVEGPLEGTSMGSEAKRLKKDQSSGSKRPAETSPDDLSAEIERRSVAALLEAPQEEVDYNDRPTLHEVPLAAYPEWAEVGQVLDERSGEVLEPDKVKKARGRELEKMETHGVEKDIRLSEAKSRIAVIPPKDLFDGEWAWELVKAMNGTREASRQWSLYIRSAMVPEGFRLSELVPNLFHHDEWDITMACHGDDFIAEGTAADLDRLDGIMKRHFQVKVLPRIGDPSYGGAVAEGNHLNRIIQWSDKGFSWQADPKHAVEFVKELGLEGSKGVETPASKDTGRNERHADDPLSSSDASEFRRLAGIALYLSLDRPSIPFPVLQIAAGETPFVERARRLQDAVEKGELKVKKEKTSENWADLGTKILDAPRVAELMSKMPLFRRGLVGACLVLSAKEFEFE
ncbi:unnamed protein product [Durusdinium trenchii]|uniref:Integrase catalytic domain-containing protein n=1 Tax=Durusdinium trenchii TaxID=1381693 RepID=A0ABP0HZM5_9DINO